MKFATKFLILLLLFSGAFAQHTLKVEKVITLTTPQQGFFFYPKLTPDGQKVLFTGPRFKGLYLLDLSNRQITRRLIAYRENLMLFGAVPIHGNPFTTTFPS